MDTDEPAALAVDRMEAFAVADLFDAAQGAAHGTFELSRGTLAGGRVRLFASSSVEHSLANRAVGLGSWAGAPDGVCDELDRWRAGLGALPMWLDLPQVRSSCWDRWLAARTAVPTGVGRHLLAHRGGLAPVARSSLRVSRVGSHEADDVGRLLAHGLGLASAVGSVLAVTVARDGWHVFVARAEDRPVAAATLVVRGGEGFLGPAATALEARRHGAHLGLTATIIRAASDLGCRRLLASVPDAGSGDGAPLLRNLTCCGFGLLATTAGFVLPSTAAVSARRSSRQPSDRRREFAHATLANPDHRPLARDR